MKERIRTVVLFILLALLIGLIYWQNQESTKNLQGSLPEWQKYSSFA